MSKKEDWGCGPTGDTEWSIPAGILNALWSDIYPRLLAKDWAGGISIPADITTRNDLRDKIAALTGSDEFNRRRDEVLEYIDADPSEVWNPAGTDIPVWIMGESHEGGFDFILSDLGIELFMPRRPDSVLELVRYYMYRSTGRRANGLPYYMNGKISGISTDAPTGPSQVFIYPRVILTLLAQQVASGRLSPQEAFALLRCIGSFQEELRPEEESDDVAEAVRILQYMAANLTDYRARITGFTYEAYQGIVERTRSWFVSGSVYRGIMVELPRVVATCWYDDLMARPKPVPAESDAARFKDRGNFGLRQIFRERLETSLHDCAKMAFEEAVGDPPLGTPYWEPDDVNITNRGFFFPELPDLKDPPTDPKLKLKEMLAQIRDGQAGNPVFTDSVHTT